MLPFLFISLFFLSREKLPADECILPEGAGAQLYLSNGEIITLNTNRSSYRKINEDITVTSDTLRYSGSSSGETDYHLLRIPRGGEYMLLLADGTKVWLNAETEIKYPPAFSGSERKIFLEGEAYFEVAHNPQMPFIVQTKRQDVTVLGTSFSIRAYDDETQDQTTLETGKVNVKNARQEIILQPGEQARVSQSGISVSKVNTPLYTSWHKGIFIFDDQPLEEILHTLERWYNISVTYSDPALRKFRFTGELKKYENAKDFLSQLEELEKVKFETNGRKIMVYPYK